MKVTSLTASTAATEPVNGAFPQTATVTITLDDGQEITLTVRQSQAYSDTITVDIDGDLSADNPAMRVNLNDVLIYDSVPDLPAFYDTADRRQPDMPWPNG